MLQAIARDQQRFPKIIALPLLFKRPKFILSSQKTWNFSTTLCKVEQISVIQVMKWGGGLLELTKQKGKETETEPRAPARLENTVLLPIYITTPTIELGRIRTEMRGTKR